MTDILDTIDQAAESDTATDWLKGVLWQAAAEIARLRAKNAELNRRGQKASAAARDTYVESRGRGVSAGRVLANHMAGLWRDLALVLADELLWATRVAGHVDQPKDVIDGHRFNVGLFGGLVLRWLAKGEVFRDEADKARGRLEAYQYKDESGCPVDQLDLYPSIHGIPPPVPTMNDQINAALHPTGRCTCAGEGTCEWCKSHCLHCGLTLQPSGSCMNCRIPQFDVDVTMPKMKPPKISHPTHGLPVMNIHAPMPSVKPPRKEELAKAMHHVSCRTEDGNMRYGPGMMSPWDTMSEFYRSRWIKAAEEAIRKVEAD